MAGCFHIKKDDHLRAGQYQCHSFIAFLNLTPTKKTCAGKKNSPEHTVSIYISIHSNCVLINAYFDPLIMSKHHYLLLKWLPTWRSFFKVHSLFSNCWFLALTSSNWPSNSCMSCTQVCETGSYIQWSYSMHMYSIVTSDLHLLTQPLVLWILSPTTLTGW